VDDASILGRGECESANWLTHAHDGANLLHAGINCGVGPVQLGAATEPARGGGTSDTGWQLEAKWARAVADGFSVGLDLQPGWQAHQRPRFTGTRASALATWKPREDVALHLNLGRDFVPGGPDLPRGGVAVEWEPAAHWSIVAERYLEERTHFARAGLRWASGRSWTVDVSRVERLSGPTPSNWTVGLTLVFGAD
jgi:hypothetical protein